jgi:hypothetical protein
MVLAANLIQKEGKFLQSMEQKFMQIHRKIFVEDKTFLKFEILELEKNELILYKLIVNYNKYNNLIYNYIKLI